MTIYAHVVRYSGKSEWITLEASCLDRAIKILRNTEGIKDVLEVSYIPGGVVS